MFRALVTLLLLNSVAGMAAEPVSPPAEPGHMRAIFDGETLEGWAGDLRLFVRGYLARGSHIRHYLNGRLILDFTDSPELTLPKGVLALQRHAGAPMSVEFRDIRLAELD